MDLQDKLQVQVKVVIMTSNDKDAPSFGKGAAQLLRGVDELGSLNKAAKRLQMAYSKAWKMISRLEESLGFALLERHGSAGSIVTDKGHDMLRRYDELDARISSFAIGEFDEIVAGPWAERK